MEAGPERLGWHGVRGYATLAGMSRAHVAVLQVVSEQMSVTAAAAEYGFSRRHLHRLLARYREGGLEALEPRSKRPKTTPTETSENVRGRVIELRRELTADGLDAGPVTIVWHLEQEGLNAPSTSTIRRILHQAGLIVPEPRKRPRSSYIRFQAAQPNEMWQSDFIHWRLKDGTDIEILNWLDDHSRYLLSCSAHQPVTGDTVVSRATSLTSRLNASSESKQPPKLSARERMSQRFRLNAGPPNRQEVRQLKLLPEERPCA